MHVSYLKSCFTNILLECLCITQPPSSLSSAEPPTNDTVGPTPSVTPSSIPVPFYQQIPFIVAMVILGLLPICCVLVLILVCCRPKDKNEYKVDTLKSTVSSPDKEPGTVRGSWTRDLSVSVVGTKHYVDSIVKFIFKLPYMDCKLHIIHYFDPKKTNANIFLSGAYLDQCFCPVNFRSFTIVVK